MDATVMCGAHTETRMDNGAAKEEYDRELEMKNQKIRELDEEPAVSKRLNADLMINMNSAQQRVRKYKEEPLISWSDDCEYKKVPTVADLLKKCSTTERDRMNSKPEATSGRNTNVDCETRT